MYLFTHYRKFVPEIVPLWLKNRKKYQNQRVHTGGRMSRGAYMRGAYTWSNKSVKEKVGLSAGAYTRGGGGL